MYVHHRLRYDRSHASIYLPHFRPRPQCRRWREPKQGAQGTYRAAPPKNSARFALEDQASGTAEPKSTRECRSARPRLAWRQICTNCDQQPAARQTSSASRSLGKITTSKIPNPMHSRFSSPRPLDSSLPFSSPAHTSSTVARQPFPLGCLRAFASEFLPSCPTRSSLYFLLQPASRP